MSQAAARADASTIAAAPSTSPQSQLAIMAGAVATTNPQGETARFVLADIKGKDAAVAYRLSVIRTAVLELLKGNPRNLKEAAALVGTITTAGKAKAYAAGFAVVADVAALERQGKWMDKENAQIRTQADTLADAYTAQFASAYATVLTSAKGKADATRAANKAAKDAAAALAASATPAAPASDDSATDDSADSVEMDIGNVVDTMVTAITQGLLSAAELVMIRAALAATDDMGVIASMGAASPLLMSQAH